MIVLYLILGYLGLMLLVFVHGWATEQHEKQQRRRIQRYLDERDRLFKESFCNGRKWLSDFIADCHAEYDEVRASYLQLKKHPARKAAEVVREVKAEKRNLTVRMKFLEYQLRSYEEYFPQLEEYRDLILDERVPLAGGTDNVAELAATDQSQLYLSRNEWEQLTVSARNQLALDRYLARSKSNWEIGRHYERYLGYLRESAGWTVVFHGALHGFEDLGRDLICKKGQEIEIVQAKCWSKTKIIHEKHVFQLFGTTIHHRLANPGAMISPVLACTTSLSDVAAEAASVLGVRVEAIPLPRHWPMIKCNINPTTKKRIYHLPFDQQYDRAQIRLPGECYVSTVKEAEKKRFRRAWRYHGATEQQTG